MDCRKAFLLVEVGCTRRHSCCDLAVHESGRKPFLKGLLKFARLTQKERKHRPCYWVERGLVTSRPLGEWLAFQQVQSLICYRDWIKVGRPPDRIRGLTGTLQPC